MATDGTNSDDNITIEETEKLLNKELNWNENLLKNVTLVIGMTGTGKSTLCQFMVGNRNLISHKTGSDFYFVDGGVTISDSTTVSKTLMPELVVHPNSSIVLADCPGFADTRDAQHDIAATFYTKKLLEKVGKVQFVVATPHHSVRIGVDRKAFTELLSHVTKFITNINKYRDGISLIVTKVENQAEPDNEGNLILVRDDSVIEQIGLFLQKVKEELKRKTQDEKTAKQIELLNIFLIKHHESYSRIGIFRRPNQIGPVEKIKILKNCTTLIENIMINELTLTDAAHGDFALTLSDASQLVVTKMQQKNDQQRSDIVDEILKSITQQHVASESTDNLEALKDILNQISVLTEIIDSNNGPHLSINKFLEHLGRSFSEQLQNKWKKQQKYFEFIQFIATQPLGTDNDYSKYYSRLNNLKAVFIEKSKIIGYKMESTINQAISSVITNIMETISHHYQNLNVGSTLSYSDLAAKVHTTYSMFDNFNMEMNQARDDKLTYYVFAGQLKNKLSMTGLANVTSFNSQLDYYNDSIDFIKNKIDRLLTDGDQAIWLSGFSTHLRTMKNTDDWYSFLINMYSKLSEYNSQKVLFNYRANNLKIWTNFKLLIEDQKWQSVGTIKQTLNKHEQNAFADLVDAVMTEPEVKCQSSTLLVNGNFITLSDVRDKFIKQCLTFTELDIFATQTVFFDVDLNMMGQRKNIYIIAPNWFLNGTRMINLSGQNGESELPTNEATGKDGIAGGPGGPGGSFLGIGDQFINGQDLTISVNGGNGGAGQKGEDGRNGDDGETIGLPEDSKWHDIFTADTCSSQMHHTTNNYKDNGAGNFALFGSKGTAGMNAGHGGKSGFGAKNGYLEIKSVNNQLDKIRKQTTHGVNGYFGQGGNGGWGGENGKTRHIKCSRYDAFFVFRLVYRDVRLESQGRASSGKNGHSNYAGIPEPCDSPRQYRQLNLVGVDYKRYIETKQFLFGKSDPISFISHSNFSPLVRRRRAAGVESYNKQDNAASSTSKIPSLINDLARYMSKTANNLWIYLPFQPGFAQINRPALVAETVDVKQTVPHFGFEVSSLVLLLDVIVRKFSQVKPTIQHSQHSNWKFAQAQADALNIVEKCENKFFELQQLNKTEIVFNPLVQIVTWPYLPMTLQFTLPILMFP
jgi:energy-coupling factor transporter ATP-binding protein EcfA2